MVLDLFGCSEDKLSNNKLILETLSSFPAKMGMEKRMPANVFKYSGENPEEWGISGIVLTAGAHISTHTFPSKGHVVINIFSEKEINVDLITGYFVQLFGASKHEVVSVCQTPGDEIEWVGAAVTPRIFH